MNKALLVVGFACGLLATAAVSPVEAKTAPDKIAITGPGLSRQVELTDPAALAGFSPWSRGFIAWDRGLASQPADTGPSYTATFYLDKGDGQLSPIYVLTYRPEPSNQRGEIYLPGPGDDGYRLNIGTIITGSSDHWNPNGKWQYATNAWVVAVGGAIHNGRAGIPQPASPDPVRSTAQPGVPWIDAVFSGLAITAACTAWLWLRRKSARARVNQ